eukprot:scaffold20198_cov73-Cyclotella_meneghiniana.AAC.5
MEGKVMVYLLPAPPTGNRFYPVTGKNGNGPNNTATDDIFVAFANGYISLWCLYHLYWASRIKRYVINN